MEIAKAIHEYQQWLSRLSTAIVSASTQLFYAERGYQSNWDSVRRETSSLLETHRVGAAWIVALEEYEILFPETRSVRVQLLERGNQIIRFLGEFSLQAIKMTFPNVNVEEQRTAVDSLTSMQNYLGDQGALTHDLLVHLQNAALGRIFRGRRRVPERTPEDEDVPVVALGPDGQLRIMAFKDSSRPETVVHS